MSKNNQILVIRKKADIQQIVWHLDVGLSFPKSVLKMGWPLFRGPHFEKYFV